MIRDMEAVLDYWHSVEFFNSYDLDDQLEQARGRRQNTICVRADAPTRRRAKAGKPRPGERGRCTSSRSTCRSRHG